MTKNHTFTDRAYRYKNRIWNKYTTELACTIKKKTVENDNYRELIREAHNALIRVNTFNRFIYKTYSELYTNYNNLLCMFDETKRNLHIAEQKLKETEELYENLEEIYNEKVTDYEKLKNGDVSNSNNFENENENENKNV